MNIFHYLSGNILIVTAINIPDLKLFTQVKNDYFELYLLGKFIW